MATQEELVVQFKAETAQMRREMAAMQSQLNDFTNTTRTTSREYRRSIENMGNSNSEYSQRLREIQAQQREAFKPHIEELKRTQLAYLDAAQSMGTYQGSAQDLIATINEIGAAEKAANDAMMANDVMMQASILQTIGMMNNMSTTSSKLQANLRTMGNPLYNLSHGALTATNAIERLANSGSAAQLALEFVGPNASAKQLADQIALINQGVMRMQMVALAASVACAALYGALHSANMEMNPKYAEAFNNMMEKLTEALQPMRDAFAAVMIPVYNFVSAIADLIIKFNEAHPTMAKFIQGAIMLVPALTLILSPLAVGIGLFAGYRAALFAVWMLIKPLVLGLAMVSPVAWAVAAAISALVVGFSYAYKTIEPFRNAVDKIIASIKSFGQALVELGKYLSYVLITGDAFDDVVSNLPPSVQKLAGALDNVMVAIHAFGQALVALSKYLFWVVASGDTMNDWITHLPEGFQGAAQVIGEAVNVIRGAIIGLFNAVKAAFNGDFSQLTQIFENLIPSIIAIIVGGIPGLVISIGTMFVRMSEGMGVGGATLTAKFGEILNNLVQWLMTFVSTQLPVFIEQGMKILTGLIQGIVTAIPQIVTAITQIITVFVQGFALLLPQIIQIGVNLITTLIQGITQMLPALVAGALQIVTALVQGITQMLPLIIQSGIQIITTLIQAIIPLIPQLVQSGIQILMALINGIIQVLPAIIDAAITIMQQLITTLVENLPLIIDAGIQVLNALINGIIQVLPQIIDAVLQIVTKFTEAIVQNLPKIIDSGIKILEKLIEGIIKIIPQIIDAVIKIITKFTETIVQNLPKIIDAGVKILTKLIEGIIKAVPQLIAAAIKLMGDLLKTIIQHLPQLLEAGAKLILELIKGIISIAGQVVSAAGDIGKSIIDSLKKVDLIQVGKDIINGLIKGIGSMANAAWQAAKDVASSVKNAVTDFLGIHSPSRVMRDMGIYVGQGLVKGINSMENPVYKAAQTMAESVKDSFNKLSDGIALGDVSMDSVVAPAIPNVSAGYTTPSNISRFSASASFGQKAMVTSQTTRNSGTNKVNDTTQTSSGQAAVINVQIGKQQFSTFVDDISNEQEAAKKRRDAFLGR